MASTGGTASGPVSFLRLYDTAAGVVSMGGRRRGACMAVLDASHPDIYDFVTTKADSPSELTHFNLSVGVTDAFMRAVERGGTPPPDQPANRQDGCDGCLPPSCSTAICEAAHACGDPGTGVPRHDQSGQPDAGAGPNRGDQPVRGGSAAALRVVQPRLDQPGPDGHRWSRRLGPARMRSSEVAVRFLDDVIDVSRYPFPELGEATRATRKIGLGVMGLAECWPAWAFRTTASEGFGWPARSCAAYSGRRTAASGRLAEDRGSFPAFADSRFARSGPRRNAQVTSVAPTGTISLIAGTTAGIEPMFAIAFTRADRRQAPAGGQPVLRPAGPRSGLLSRRADCRDRAARGVRGCPQLPAEVRAAFPTAAEIAPEWHLRMQAAVQRHVDAAVSKTVNLPATATVDDVRAIYLAAWKAKVKGITVYRYGSREGQVLSYAAPDAVLAQADTAFSGGCVGRDCEF